jgi:hypothetical protein
MNMEVIPAREFNSLYIYLDIVWLVIYAVILLWRRRHIAFIAGLIGGIIYFAVDYGIFYLLLKTRVITGADPFWFLLWLSVSYGFTNFAWIWILLDKGGNKVEWSLFTITGWVAVAMLSQNFGAAFPLISIYRGTTYYHGVMALILAAGYIYLIIRNFRVSSGEKVNLLRLLAIGIGVQFSWELVLLLSGIRAAGIMPLIVNSLIETNMGIPYLYLIHRAVSRRFNENLLIRTDNRT